MSNADGEPKGDECFCCGTHVDKIIEPQRFRGRWRRRCLMLLALGASATAVAFALMLYMDAPGVGVFLGFGLGFASMAGILMNKFPKVPR